MNGLKTNFCLLSPRGGSDLRAAVYAAKSMGLVVNDQIPGRFYVPSEQTIYATLRQVLRQAVDNGAKISLTTRGDNGVYEAGGYLLSSVEALALAKVAASGGHFQTLVNQARMGNIVVADDGKITVRSSPVEKTSVEPAAGVMASLIDSINGGVPAMAR